MEKILIWIDDIRDPKDENWARYISQNYPEIDSVIWLKTFYEVAGWIEAKGLPYAVSFDHDLGDINSTIEKTGYDCAKYIVDYCIDNYFSEFPKYTIQSDNGPGRKNIDSYIQNYISFRNKKFNIY